MAKGIARLGILYTLLLIAHGASAATVADLLISEIMVDPAAVSDSRGEWFELYNPTGDEINLRGITIGDDGGDRHRIESDLLILPAHFLTLARNGDSLLNGGLSVDYIYDDFILGNSGDEIVLSEGPTEKLRLEYDASFDVAGQSRELIGSALLAANYGLTFAGLTYGLGDIGTPGAPGGTSLATSVVPLPAAAWLFITGILAIFRVIPGGLRITHANSRVVLKHRNSSKAEYLHAPDTPGPRPILQLGTGGVPS
ncbi:MAG: lamin tail domain-containing protein [Gammaproteobacteria bacterium]|nr:lamin tail domain-containing protein [Gammaproteobacteria bacterium]